MKKSLATVLCLLLAVPAYPSGQTVKYSGGSIPNAESGQDFKLSIGKTLIQMSRASAAIAIPSTSVTELSYGQEAHRRVGTAVATAIFTYGIGALFAFSKSKKHYIGIIWQDGAEKGGITIEVSKNDFRGVLTGLEGVTGKKAIDTDNIKNRPN